MENRLELNKRPVYELPDEVLVGEYRKKVNQIPNFEPDIIINSWGVGGFCSIGEKYDRAFQLWIKSTNKDLLAFIKSYNFKNVILSSSSPRLLVSRLKKIILEEFYGVKYGE